MKELSVYYCPTCGRYSYCSPAETPTCPICEVPMAFLTPYSSFCCLNKEERDKLLIYKIIAGDPSIPGRFLAYIRSLASVEAATLVDSRIQQLESENKKLNDTIQWMHQTIWDLLCKNKNLEHLLENSPSADYPEKARKNDPSP